MAHCAYSDLRLTLSICILLYTIRLAYTEYSAGALITVSCSIQRHIDRTKLRRRYPALVQDDPRFFITSSFLFFQKECSWQQG